MKRSFILIALLLLASGVSAETYPAEDICKKAVKEDRMGGLKIPDCLCIARVNQKVFSPELYSLWSQAMYLGESRMREIELLPQGQWKTERQVKKAMRQSKKKCGLR